MQFFLAVTFPPSLFHEVLQISCLRHSAQRKAGREETCEPNSTLRHVALKKFKFRAL